MNPGKRKGENVGSVLLIHEEDGEISGTIRLEGEIYRVSPLNGGMHALVNVDESKYSLGGDSPLNSGAGASDVQSKSSSGSSETPTPSKQSPSSVREKETCQTSTAALSSSSSKAKTQSSSAASCPQRTANVLVVYTSAAANGININNRIDKAIEVSNTSYNNSNAYSADLNLVHSEQIGFTETDIREDIGDIQNDSQTESLREQYDADIVVLLGEYGGAGLADEIRAEAEDAYAIVGVSRAAGGGLVFPHEVGHLQGAQHHPDDPTCTKGDPRCDPESHRFPDAFGHRFSDTDCTLWVFDCETDYYASVMAYTQSGFYWINNDHNRVTHFSNPNVKHDGKKTGTGSRYNADALQTTANTVENFRFSDDLRASISMTASGDPGDPARTSTATPCGGTGSYSYEWRISYNGPGNYGSVLSRSEEFFQKFPDGTHYVKLTVTSGSETDVAIQPVYVYSGYKSGYKKSTTADSEQKTSKTEEQQSSKAGPERPEEVALRGATPNPMRAGGSGAEDPPGHGGEVTCTPCLRSGQSGATGRPVLFSHNAQRRDEKRVARPARSGSHRFVSTRKLRPDGKWRRGGDQG